MKITKTEAKRLIDAAVQGGVTADEFKLDKSLQNHAQNLKNAILDDVRRYIASDMQWRILINDDHDE